MVEWKSIWQKVKVPTSLGKMHQRTGQGHPPSGDRFFFFLQQSTSANKSSGDCMSRPFLSTTVCFSNGTSPRFLVGTLSWDGKPERFPTHIHTNGKHGKGRNMLAVHAKTRYLGETGWPALCFSFAGKDLPQNWGSWAFQVEFGTFRRRWLYVICCSVISTSSNLQLVKQTGWMLFGDPTSFPGPLKVVGKPDC